MTYRAARNHAKAQLITADELASLEATAHLLRSPKNAARLLSALARSSRRATAPIDLDQLRQTLGLDPEK